jgi:hypothetical protein
MFSESKFCHSDQPNNSSKRSVTRRFVASFSEGKVAPSSSAKSLTACASSPPNILFLCMYFALVLRNRDHHNYEFKDYMLLADVLVDLDDHGSPHLGYTVVFSFRTTTLAARRIAAASRFELAMAAPVRGSVPGHRLHRRQSCRSRVMEPERVFQLCTRPGTPP